MASPQTSKRRPTPDRGALLFTRAQVAALLNCSPMTVIRLTAAGRLKVIKLTPGHSAKAFYRASDVFALAEKGATDA